MVIRNQIVAILAQSFKKDVLDYSILYGSRNPNFKSKELPPSVTRPANLSNTEDELPPSSQSDLVQPVLRENRAQRIRRTK